MEKKEYMQYYNRYIVSPSYEAILPVAPLYSVQMHKDKWRIKYNILKLQYNQLGIGGKNIG